MPKKLIKNYSLLLQLQAELVSDSCDVCRSGAGCGRGEEEGMHGS